MFIQDRPGAWRIRVHLIGLMTALLAAPACAHHRTVATTAPASTPAGAPSIAPAVEHPLAPDFRRLGEALATFWRAEERFPSDVEELRGFAEEHQLDLRLTQVTNLSLRSKLYGKVLTGQCDFPFPSPEGVSVRSSAAFELDATNPDGVTVAFEATPPEGQAYLEEAYRIFSERFAPRR